VVSVEAAAEARHSVQHEAQAGERGRVTHRFVFADGSEVEFTQRRRYGGERACRDRVVEFAGNETAEVEPASTFEAAADAAGLPDQAVDALRLVSSHEGGFDAINTWDSARFSWGFIQFAGGRGLPSLLGHIKSRNPDLFAKLLGRYGIDVLPDADGDPVPVFVNTRSGDLRYGKSAEQAYGDSPLAIALFIRAARETEIKQLQVEAAIEHYALPALSVTYHGVPLSRVLSSPKSLAMLIDRKVHEGNLGRFHRAMTHVEAGSRLGNPAEWPLLESQVVGNVVSNTRPGGMIGSRLRSILYSELPGPVVQ